jgi:hypothetical protein
MRYGVICKVGHTNIKIKSLTKLFHADSDQEALTDVADRIRYLVCKVDARIYNLDTKRVFPCRNYPTIGYSI